MQRVVLLLQLGLVTLPSVAESQDPLMGAMATGIATKMAGVVLDKVEREMKNSTLPEPCAGPQCCQKSSCMNAPGWHCDASRGATRCVGSAFMHAHEGQCACLHGPCGLDGSCPAALSVATSAGAFPQASQPQAKQLDTASAKELGSKMEIPGKRVDFLTQQQPSRLFQVDDIRQVGSEPEGDPRRSLNYFVPLVGATMGFGLLLVAAVAVHDRLRERRYPVSVRAASAAREEERLVRGDPQHLET